MGKINPKPPRPRATTSAPAQGTPGHSLLQPCEVDGIIIIFPFYGKALNRRRDISRWQDWDCVLERRFLAAWCFSGFFGGGVGGVVGHCLPRGSLVGLVIKNPPAMQETQESRV